MFVTFVTLRFCSLLRATSLFVTLRFCSLLRFAAVNFHKKVSIFSGKVAKKNRKIKNFIWNFRNSCTRICRYLNYFVILHAISVLYLKLLQKINRIINFKNFKYEKILKRTKLQRLLLLSLRMYCNQCSKLLHLSMIKRQNLPCQSVSSPSIARAVGKPLPKRTCANA